MRWILSVLVLSACAFAQSTALKVRLYSTHLPQQVEIRSTSGDLHWKACQGCPESLARNLSIKVSGDSVLLTPSYSPLSELLITGNYKLVPEQQPGLAAAFPL